MLVGSFSIEFENIWRIQPCRERGEKNSSLMQLQDSSCLYVEDARYVRLLSLCVLWRLVLLLGKEVSLKVVSCRTKVRWKNLFWLFLSLPSVSSLYLVAICFLRGQQFVSVCKSCVWGCEFLLSHFTSSCVDLNVRYSYPIFNIAEFYKHRSLSLVSLESECCKIF